ncbi:hypothetical protein LTR78_004182 [Recurvomyces mirabilis]|uniref:Uncharacterized protein n=1 Tax=Recurvomyces mirabilis TaxID=574656 RepID=A0AAE0WQE6_9PEZI|nr:hypothetical protein LTR78_004182 [Recurvomyces mirabilis]KAK5153647.1 hypothetical protein LTS14_007341 [Recurvomyces mirabilis]
MPRCVKSGWNCPGYAKQQQLIEEGVVVTDDRSPTSGSNDDTPPSSTTSPNVFTQFASPTTPGEIPNRSATSLGSTIVGARWGLPRVAISISPRISPTSTFRLKITDVERHAWDFFYATTYPSLQIITPLAGLLLPTIQLSFECEPIFRAITATGNAHSDPGSTFDTSLRRWYVQADRRAFHRQYGQALSSLRAHMMKNAHDEQGLQVVLGSCLLLVLYNILEEQASDAKAHLGLGLRILQERSPNEKIVGHPIVPPPGPFARPVLEVFKTMLEEDATLESATALYQPPDDSSLTISNDFPNLAEARVNLDGLRSMYEQLQKQLMDIARDRVAELSGDSASHAVTSCLTVCMAKTMNLDEHVVLQARMQRLKNDLDAWSNHFARLLAKSGEVSGRAPLLLQIQHFATSFSLYNLRNTIEVDTDLWHAHFKSVVGWCKEFIHLTATNLLYWMQDPSKPRTETQHGGWSAEMRVLPALYLVGTKCRNVEVRRQAMDLLNTADRREGIHHSAVLGRIVGAVMDVEMQLARSMQEREPSLDKEVTQPGHFDEAVPEAARFSEVIVGGGEGPPPFVKLCCSRILPSLKEGSGSWVEISEWRADSRPFVMKKMGSQISDLGQNVRQPRTFWARDQ